MRRYCDWLRGLDGVSEMIDNFNKLTPAETERLAILAEEMAESIHVIGKILRHGFEDKNPNIADSLSNRANLEKELGHVRNSMIMMCESGDLSKDVIHLWAEEKRASIGIYLHHQVD